MSTRNAMQTAVSATAFSPTTPTVTATATLFSLIGGTPVSTLTPAGTASCDSSLYLADITIPDGTTVTVGQTFTKTWKVSNAGTCAWKAGYQIVFIDGNAMSGKATPIGREVKPGESVEISVAMTAPSTTGTVKGTWRLSNDKGQPFGTLLTIEIKVNMVTATPTKIGYPNP